MKGGIPKWCPAWLRAIVLHRRARASAQAALAKLAEARVSCAGALGHGFTKFARRTVKRYARELEATDKAIETACLKSTIRVRGLGPLQDQLRSLDGLLDNVRSVLDEDAKALSHSRTLHDRYMKARERAAHFAVGLSRTHEARFESDFLRTYRNLPKQATLAEVRSHLKELEALIQKFNKRLDRLDEFKIEIGLIKDRIASLDDLKVTIDPDVKQRYDRLVLRQDEAERAFAGGDCDRALSFLSQAQSDYAKINADLDNTERHMREEIALWENHFRQDTRLPPLFLAELLSFPGQPSGADMQRWRELRLKMEEAIQQIADSSWDANTRSQRATASRLKWQGAHLDQWATFAKAVKDAEVDWGQKWHKLLA